MNQIVTEDEQGYTWETEYERTWEALQEDAEGSLQASVMGVVTQAKRRPLLTRTRDTRLGMMRHVYVVVDMSAAMTDQDLKPCRLAATQKLLETFVEEYFDENPISQLGILTTSNKRAHTLTQLAGNLRRHINCVRSLEVDACGGEPSLQNTLDLAVQSLRHVPSHASREVVIILGSLTTCDPGDIADTIKALKEHNIRVSVIGLAAEICVCKRICNETKGHYGVILDESHFRELLRQHVTPPPASVNSESSLIRMGFPHHQMKPDNDAIEKPSFCLCHLDSKGSITTLGYFCPQCKSKYCELPVQCKVCGLTLVSAPHLARTYHHLFPLDPFREVAVTSLEDDNRFCYSCCKYMTEPNVYQCNRCRHFMCLDCDLFVHQTLHSCPGCASSRATQQIDMEATPIT